MRNLVLALVLASCGVVPSGPVDLLADGAREPNPHYDAAAVDAARDATAPHDSAAPLSCSFPQNVPDPAGFIAHATSYSDTDPTIDAAVNAVMAKLSGCSVGSRCPLDGFAGSTAGAKCQSWFAAVTQELRNRGFCAGQHVVGGTDEIAVNSLGCTNKWYGYHICYYGGPTVVWNPGARRGWWEIAPACCTDVTSACCSTPTGPGC